MANLGNLTDQGNHILTQLSYFSDVMNDNQTVGEWFEDVQNNTDLQQKLKDNDKWSLFEKIKADLEKTNSPIRQIEIIASGNDSDTGFGAIAFRDDQGNIGFSFRGTDGLKVESLNDWTDNAMAAMTGNSLQNMQAEVFYNKYKDKNGKNYLYGHSKGGEIASEIFVDDYKNIKSCHVLNAQPINPFYLRNDQLDALNSDKFDPVIIEKDYVWIIGGCPYSFNIRVMKSDGENPHLYDSSCYKEDGSIRESDMPALYILFGSGISATVAGIQLQFYQIYQTACIFIDFVKEHEDEIKAALNVVESIFSTALNLSVTSVEILMRGFEALAIAVQSIFTTIINPGKSYAQNNPYIQLNTNQLDHYANRIANVNKRLINLDVKIKSLYGRVGLLDLYNLIHSDLTLGYNLALNASQNYLNSVADEFNQIESDLLRGG